MAMHADLFIFLVVSLCYFLDFSFVVSPSEVSAGRSRKPGRDRNGLSLVKDGRYWHGAPQISCEPEIGRAHV